MKLELQAAWGLFYFPSVTWLANAVTTGHAVFNPNEQHSKKTNWNRMELAGGEGKVRLSIPLKGGRMAKTSYDQLEISKEYPWREQHWKTIVSCYNRSPWFEFYRDSLQELYLLEEVSLWKWNINCLEWMLNKFGVGESISIGEDTQMDRGVQVNDYPIYSQIQSIVYQQVFQHKTGFLPGLSSLDLLFCEGRNAKNRLFNKS